MPVTKTRTVKASVELVTIESVPIVEVGTFPLSTGITTFTEADLADAVKAANEDNSVKAPRLKLGHAGAGWQAGEPSFGNFTNLRLSDNGQQIVADIEGVPAWLSEIMPVAYPNRSIEGEFGYESTTGKFYRFVIHAVALLGVELPGVTTLDDLKELFENPEVAVVAVKAARPRVTVKAQIDAEDVRRSFYETEAQGDRWFWWIRSMRLDPNELICEDEETGNLYRIPFTVKDKDVAFGEAVEVFVVYEDMPEDEKEKEPAKASRTFVSWHKAADSRIKRAKGAQMDPNELREQLGLPEDATDEEVKAKIDSLKALEDEADEDDDLEDEGPEDEDDEDEDEQTEEAPTQEPATSVASDGSITLDPDAYRRLQSDAAMGRDARKQQIKERRESVVDAAIAAGKFPPARRKHYLQLMDKDEEGTSAFIAKLEENVIPVAAKGSVEMPDDVIAENDAYDMNWLTPAERSRIAAARGED